MDSEDVGRSPSTRFLPGHKQACERVHVSLTAVLESGVVVHLLCCYELLKGFWSGSLRLEPPRSPQSIPGHTHDRGPHIWKDSSSSPVHGPPDPFLSLL